MFIQSEFALILIVFILWGLVQIPLSFFLSTMYNRTRTSSIMGYLIVILGVITSLILNSALYSTDEMPR